MANINSFDKLAPRNPIKVKTVYYPWSSFDAMYYSQIFSDEFFYSSVEQNIIYEAYIKLFAQTFHKTDASRLAMSQILGHDLPEVLNEYDEIFVDDIQKQNVIDWITIMAKITKMVTYDSLFSLMRTDVESLEPVVTSALPSSSSVTTLAQDFYYESFYSKIQPIIEVQARKAIVFIIESHNKLGETSTNSNMGNNQESLDYSIDKNEDAMIFVKLLVQCVIKELVKNIITKPSFMLDKKAKSNSNIEYVVTGIIDVELGLMTSDKPEILEDISEDSGDEQEKQVIEVVAARVNNLLAIFDVPSISYMQDFVRQMAKLAIGAKLTDFGLTKRDVTGVGSPTNDRINSKRIHRASNKDKMLMSNTAGKYLLQKKADEKQLTERKRVSQNFTTGGEVFLLLDATGSTMPSWQGYGIINFEEALAVSMADACRSAGRKLTVYFYNEGTTAVHSFNPTEPEKSYKFKKQNLYGNYGFRGNDEYTTFQEVFAEINKKPGAKHSVLFVSDGGILTMRPERKLVAQQTKALMSLYPNIEVMPILINSYIEDTFVELFDGYKMIQIDEIEDFDVTKLNECIKFVKQQELE